MALASVLPSPVSRSIAETAAVIGSRSLAASNRVRGIQDRRQMVARHLRRVYGPGLGRWQLERLVDQAFASYARYWAESLELPHLRPEQVSAGMNYDRYDRIQAGVDAGKGTILALPHLGGWEWAGAHLASLGHPITVVVEKLEPPDVFDWFVAYRQKLGMEVVAVGPGAASRCVQALADNHLLCLLSDRLVGGASGVEVEFFGERTLLPAGPATLAIRTGATILPAAVFFERSSRDHLGIVRPPLQGERTGRLRNDVQTMTQALAVEFEALIRRAPTQWHMMQPNWPSDTQPPSPE